MTMRNKKNVPDIRFKGFLEKWIPVTLGELSEPLEYGLNAAATIYDGVNKYIRITDIDDSTHLLNCTGLTSPNVNLSLSSRYQLKNGDVLFARTGASVGKSYHYKETDGVVYYAGFLIRAHIKPSINSEFIFQRTLTKEYDKYVKITSQRSGQPGINAQEYSSWILTIPTSLDEQQTIGSYFQNIDKLINTSQKKLNKLKNIKKACLDKMFPQKGSNIPRLRFKGFTEEWEETTIKDIANDFYGGGTPRTSIEKYWDGIIPWIQTSDLKEGQIFGVVPLKYISDSGVKDSATKLVPENSIAIITRVGVGKLSLIPFKYTTSQDFLSISKLKIDEYFAAYSLHRKMQTVLKEVQGTSIKGITKEELLSKKIDTPTKTDEQNAIGKFFINIDDLIAKTEQQLNKLKNIKKACLNKMFVNTEDVI